MSETAKKYYCDKCMKEIISPASYWIIDNHRYCQECYKLNFSIDAQMENKDKQIAQLKQQLAESEEYNQMLLEEKSGYIDLVSGYSKKCKNYEQQLAEGDSEIAENVRENECLKDQIYDLKQQLTEKEKAIEEINKEFVQAVKDWKSLVEQKEKEIEKITKVVAYRDDKDLLTTINGVKFTNEQIITLQNIDYFADKHNQDKISFAVEQLEKVRSDFEDRLIGFKWSELMMVAKCCNVINDVLDNQINQLKEGK